MNSEKEVLEQIVGKRITRAEQEGGCIYLTLDDDEVLGVVGQRMQIGLVAVTEEWVH